MIQDFAIIQTLEGYVFGENLENQARQQHARELVNFGGGSLCVDDIRRD